jgi:hypothetical protein
MSFDKEYMIKISEQVDLNWELERTQTSGYCFAIEKQDFSNFKM